MPGPGQVHTWPSEEHLLRLPGPLSQQAGAQEAVCGGPLDQWGREPSSEVPRVPFLQGLLTTHLAEE